MRPPAGRRITVRTMVVAGGALALCACSIDDSVGYVEIKMVPSSIATPLYLDTTRLEPIRNGTAVLRQKVGTAKLQVNGDGPAAALLCNVTIQKNRITSVTISVVGRQLRCQCGRASVNDARTCIA
jgi:hypothetical protein